MSKRKEIFKLTKLKKYNGLPELRVRKFISVTIDGVECHELHLYATMSHVTFSLRNKDYRIDPTTFSSDWTRKHWWFRMEHTSTLEHEVMEIIDSVQLGKIPVWLNAVTKSGSVLV